MDVQNTKATLKTRKRNGFSMVEILIMAAILSIVTAFGLMGITRARASVRLSGAAREYATYIEKARMHSIRNHADDDSNRANVAIKDAKTSYDVTMDVDGDGDMDIRTIGLPDGVSFETVETIGFDWRGRTVSIVDGVTTTNAQVSIRLKNSSDSVSVDVTGSGDITIDSRVFDDSVPNVNLRVADLSSGATPTPTPNGETVPAPTPEGGDTLPGADPTPPLTDGTAAEPTPSPIVSDDPDAESNADANIDTDSNTNANRDSESNAYARAVHDHNGSGEPESEPRRYDDDQSQSQWQQQRQHQRNVRASLPTFK